MVIVPGDEILKINKDIDSIMANAREQNKDKDKTPPTNLIGPGALVRFIPNNQGTSFIA